MSESTGETREMNELRTEIKNTRGVYCIDFLVSGIYGMPTIYVWTYHDYDKKVIEVIKRLKPNGTHFYASTDKRSNVPTDTEIIIKINTTDVVFPNEKIKTDIWDKWTGWGWGCSIG
jgi:hypothetical protein